MGQKLSKPKQREGGIGENKDDQGVKKEVERIRRETLELNEENERLQEEIRGLTPKEKQ